MTAEDSDGCGMTEEEYIENDKKVVMPYLLRHLLGRTQNVRFCYKSVCLPLGAAMRDKGGGDPATGAG